jgi:hypothetical protein
MMRLLELSVLLCLNCDPLSPRFSREAAVAAEARKVDPHTGLGPDSQPPPVPCWQLLSANFAFLTF